jgi:outer membrane protein TolC
MKKISLYLISFFCLPSLVNAQPLPVQRVISSINQHFPLILAAEADIAKSKANLQSAQGSFDPVIRSKLTTSTVGIYKNFLTDTEFSTPISNSGNQFFTGYRLGRGDYPSYEQGKLTYNLGEIRAGIEVPWLRDRRIDERRAKILVSHSTVAMSENELALKKLQAVRDGVFSYWDWYLEGNKLIIQQNLLKLAQDRQNVIQQRFDKGDLPRVDVIENQRIILQRKIFLSQQEQNYQKSSLLLSLYLRNDEGKPIVPTISVLPTSIHNLKKNQQIKFNTESFKSTLSQHPLMKQFEQQRNISYIDLSLAENSLKPKFSNRVYLARDFGPGNPPLNRTSINLDFIFELPLNQRQALGSIQSAKSSLERVDQDQKLFIDRLSVNIKTAKNQIKMVNAVNYLAQEELALAKKLELAEKDKYAHGDSNLFLINLREQSTVETYIKLITAIADSNKAKEEYIYSLGRSR